MMAIKTQFSEADFVKILSQYDLGTFTRAAPVAQGTVQTNYFIYTTQGKFVFRYYENRSRESALFECDLLVYLNKRRFSCPAPITDRTGAFVNETGGKPYVIFTFLEGAPVEEPEWHHKRQLIEQVAGLAKLTEGFKPVCLEHRWNYNPKLCRELASEQARQLGTQEARRKLAWLEGQLAGLELPEALPMGVCHCDFHFANVFFQGERFAGLIDFDDANYTYLLFDLAALIDGWAWQYPNDWLDFAPARQMASVYEGVRPLSALERRHLYDVHKLGILFDCIWFFGRGGADDFYEKRKAAFLNGLGREGYQARLFDKGRF